MSFGEPKGPTEAQLAHQALIRTLDIHSVHKSFRSPRWRPNQRRNKNLKTILGDISKREAAATASALATPADESEGFATPATGRRNQGGRGGDNGGLSTSGSSTPATETGAGAAVPNLAQASRSLSKLVLEKSLRPGNGSAVVPNTTTGLGGGNGVGGGTRQGGPTATYTNIESAPSLACTKRYCDVTGLPAPYLDPKTRMRYHNREVFAFIRGLPPTSAEMFLEARGAHTVLK